jgi:hypothetical protein
VAEARALCEQALGSLLPFGEHGTTLTAIARFIVSRDR